MSAALWITGYIVGWIATAVVVGPSMADRSRVWMDPGDWVLAVVVCLLWPVIVAVGVPITVVAWIVRWISDAVTP